MNKKLSTKPGLAAAILFLSCSAAVMITPVTAIEVSNYRQTGEALDAAWYQQSADGCIDFSVSLSASNVNAPGQAETMPFVFLFASTYNYCTSESSFGWGYSNDIQITGKGPTKAALIGIIQTSGCSYGPNSEDFACADHIVDVDVQWTADNSDVQRGSYTYRNQDPNGIYMSRYRGTYAYASAFGSLNQDGTTALITGDSQYAAISDNMSGSLFVSHP
ncbi:MAG: hypothetical protein ACU843_09725 [Gammaproteobacteria bacterium]